MSGRRRSDGVPLYIMQMTARGAPMGGGVDGVFAFMDLAHQTVFSLFRSLRTPEIQQKWGPFDAADVE